MDRASVIPTGPSPLVQVTVEPAPDEEAGKVRGRNDDRSLPRPGGFEFIRVSQATPTQLARAFVWRADRSRSLAYSAS